MAPGGVVLSHRRPDRGGHGIAGKLKALDPDRKHPAHDMVYRKILGFSISLRRALTCLEFGGVAGPLAFVDHLRR